MLSVALEFSLGSSHKFRWNKLTDYQSIHKKNVNSSNINMDVSEKVCIGGKSNPGLDFEPHQHLLKMIHPPEAERGHT